MILRIWRATATHEGAAQYQEFFEQRRLPGVRSVPGFLRASLLNREHNGVVEIEVHSYWESLDAIHAFAGPGLDTAVVEPELQPLLLTWETTTAHFDILEYGK